ncbi:MAG: hypothetical protein OXC59_01545 [Acidimicrobiaceae bacterium]|nr:hypothetical protein [Acidimicrobiaceae bacterium]
MSGITSESQWEGAAGPGRRLSNYSQGEEAQGEEAQGEGAQREGAQGGSR